MDGTEETQRRCSAGADYTPLMPALHASVGVILACCLSLPAGSATIQQGPPPPPGIAPTEPGRGRFPSPTPEAPIRLEPSRFDLGVVAPGSVHRRTFRIVNDGPMQLRVRAASPSCRCTTVTDVVGKTIPAQGSLELEAQFDAPKTPGVKDATVNIVLDGAPRPLVATISGDVTLPIRVEPPFVDALAGKVGGTVRLTSIDGRPFTILSAGGRPPVFADPAPTGPAAAQSINWTTAGLACEKMPLWWIVVTDHPDCPIVPLRIRHECTGTKADMARYDRFWILSDQLVSLGTIRAGEATSFEVQLDHYNPKGRGRIERPNFRDVRAATIASPDLELAITGTRPVGTDSVVISMTVTPKPGTSGAIETFLRVETATGAGEVPFVAVVAP